jgi:hypothetical protein
LIQGCLLLMVLATTIRAEAVIIQGNGALQIGGRPAFPIGFTTFPAPGAQAPSGGDAYHELAKNGVVFNRCSAGPNWNREAEAALDSLLDHAARAGVLCALYIHDLAVIKPDDHVKKDELRRVVMKYRSHPAVAFWKSADEPEWGKIPPENLRVFYETVHDLDPNHPVWITQAPRGTIESLKRYQPFYDIGAMDVYPVSYPPGVHSDLPNKSLSVVGDYAKRIGEATGSRKPIWMVLQICFSGVVKPGKTLRFPTFPEQRYMSYQSIIHGARGLLYFGGNVEACWNERDRALGWNWTFYDKVLKPVLDEFHPSSPLYPALIAADSQRPVRVEGADDVEFRVRETGDYLFLLAAKREGRTVQVKFHGLPEDVKNGDLLYEEPRKVVASGGSFSDWFGPNEVHVYRFPRSGRQGGRQAR